MHQRNTKTQSIMKQINNFTAVVNIDPARKNFIIITPMKDGRASIDHDAMSDEEIDENIDDFFAANEVGTLEIGESAIINDMQIVVRIS